MTSKNFKKDFPILTNYHNGKRLAYLDNAATTHKPESVLAKINTFYREENSNVHRGIYSLSQRATDSYELARNTIKKFINAKYEEEVIYTSGTTDGMNLLAYSYALDQLKPDDEIIVTHMEHHSNIVPWQMIAKKTGSHLRAVNLTEEGKLDLEHFYSLLNPKTKILTMTYVSNSIGTINPLKEMTHSAHEYGAVVVADAAQAVLHFPIDVQDLNIDFMAFSGHKLLGPTGIGVLYGKKEFLEKMPPFRGGGEMMTKVTMENTIFKSTPYKFEAGTPHIAGVIGLHKAVEYVNQIGFNAIMEQEAHLMGKTRTMLENKPFVKVIGNHFDKIGVFSLVIQNIHPHDAGSILDQYGVAVRVGQHCTQPIMDYFKVPATVRVSLAFYNDDEDIEQLDMALDKVVEILK